jgi:predicted amidohydrolase YtcJ
MSKHLPRREFIKTAAVTGLAAMMGDKFMLENAEAARTKADLILTNGKIATVGTERNKFAESAAIKDGRFLAVGSEREVLRYKGDQTQVLNLNKRTVIPGLNDSHMHPIRAGLNYNMELRWDGVDSLADAMNMLKTQAKNTPPPQWVRVVGGWTEFQFKEKRMPTLAEINAVSPDTPVFILHLYDRAFLNGAALRAIGYGKNTPDPPQSIVERDSQGNPTGLLIAKPNALVLYSALAKGPKLSYDDQINSSRQFMRELNRLGVTSVIDAGGGFQNYADDYKVIEQLHKDKQLTTRFAYNLFTQKPKEELADFERWTKMVKPGQGDDFFRHNGAGEMLVFSAADFEDFLEPRPDLAASMEDELFRVVSLLAQNKWAFRLHATYDESISRALNVYERVHREVAPIDKLHWFIDHAETVSDKNIERIRNLGGGIAIQHRMAFQGEYFRDLYGAQKTKHSPPIRRMLELGVPVGAGTDATRVASYNPFVSLYWLVAGKTVGGLQMYDDSNRLSREEALRLWTVGSSWFSSDNGTKGAIEAGHLADLAVLSGDYFSIAEEQIKSLESVLTIVGGKIVYAAEEFKNFAPPALPVSPSWSPVKTFGGYQNQNPKAALAGAVQMQRHDHRLCGGAHGVMEKVKNSLGNLPNPFGDDFGFACSCAF